MFLIPRPNCRRHRKRPHTNLGNSRDGTVGCQQSCLTGDAPLQKRAVRHGGSATSAIAKVDATTLLCQCVAVAVVSEKHMADAPTDKFVVSLVRNVCQPSTAELEKTIDFADGTTSDALAKVLTRSAEVVRTAATE